MLCITIQSPFIRINTTRAQCIRGYQAHKQLPLGTVSGFVACWLHRLMKKIGNWIGNTPKWTLNGGKLKIDDQPSNVGVFLIGFGQRPPQKNQKKHYGSPKWCISFWENFQVEWRTIPDLQLRWTLGICQLSVTVHSLNLVYGCICVGYPMISPW